MAAVMPALASTARRHAWSRAARHDWRPLASVSVALGAWGLSYALYRGYYAVGGTLLLPCRPADPVQFRLINAVAAVILVIAAALPIAVLPLWRIPRARWVLLAVCWAGAVGCCTHAFTNGIQRVLSLAGLLRIEYARQCGPGSTAGPPICRTSSSTSPGSWWRGSGSGRSDGSSLSPVAVGDGGSAPRSQRSRC